MLHIYPLTSGDIVCQALFCQYVATEQGFTIFVKFACFDYDFYYCYFVWLRDLLPFFVTGMITLNILRQVLLDNNLINIFLN